MRLETDDLDEAQNALDNFSHGASQMMRLDLRREVAGTVTDVRQVYGYRDVPQHDDIAESHAADFISRLQPTIAQAYDLPAILGQMLGLELVASQQRQLAPKRMLVKVRRSFDYNVGHALNATIFSIGILRSERKIWVPYLDRETTPLCAHRMAWQVRRIDERFVDPQSGASWDHPPGIEGGLPADERFHYCRAVLGLA